MSVDRMLYPLCRISTCKSPSNNILIQTLHTGLHTLSIPLTTKQNKALILAQVHLEACNPKMGHRFIPKGKKNNA